MKIYQENIEKYHNEILRLKKLLDRVSFFRLLIFIFSLTLVITLFNFNLKTLAFIAIPVLILCFNFILKYHGKIAYLKTHASYLKRINELEILRGKCELEEFDTGQKFVNQNHQYTSDLDIFGQHSVFQLINRATTESGMMRLSEWLSEPGLSDNEIYERQHAINELSQKLDWRQNFQASGMHFQNKKSDFYKLIVWTEKPNVLLKHRYLYTAAAIILPIVLLFLSYFFYANLTSQTVIIYLSLIALVLIINNIILKRLSSLSEDIVDTSTNNIHTLKGYRSLISEIESENFKSKKINELQSTLLKDTYSVSDEINRITRILEFSQQRPIKKIPIGGNYMYVLLNSFLLLDIHLIIATEKWKSKNKNSLKYWADVVSEFEVLNSFAGFSYSNPSFAFPEISKKNNYVHFEELGHPLINTKHRVCNDFHSEGEGDIVMITGSNMGGKSTFLRTVGVNIVLALAGAPCCAKYGQVTNLKIFTSMRTQDNLQHGRSSFYAELNRIEEMLKLIESNQNTYFLLDEMFKGTNSEDRHKGGFSLISQLSKLKTSGIIATHDIKLAQLAGDKKLVKNYSFNSKIKDGSMIFNYKLDPKICHDFNASELMKTSGIKILSDTAISHN